VVLENLRRTLSGFVQRLSEVELDERKLRPVLDELLLSLVANDVALEVAEALCNQVLQELVGCRVGRFEKRKPIVKQALLSAILQLLEIGGRFDLLGYVRNAEKPVKMVFVGVNGTGKTTTIAKVGYLLQQSGFKVVFAASDTFRAGAIEQLKEHGHRLGIRVISGRYGADPASVAYDAVEHARARRLDAVLVDTSGRIHTKHNLMEEMKKIVRVIDADLVIFVGDALTGNDAVEQAREFHKYVGITGSILTKFDADAKGGAVISVAYITRRPILFLGVGQRYEDLQPFDPKTFVAQIAAGL